MDQKDKPEGLRNEIILKRRDLELLFYQPL